MALINCFECRREISDKAVACPGCGAPVAIPVGTPEPPPSPSRVGYNRETDRFTGNMVLVVKLAMRAIQQLGWKIDAANENLGFVSFQTSMSWGSWSGISGSISVEETDPGFFKVSGTGKQNIRGGQLIAFNIGGEAQGKAKNAIDLMKELAIRDSDAQQYETNLSEDEQMQKYAITKDRGQYVFQTYRYDKLSDAIAYAKRQK